MQRGIEAVRYEGDGMVVIADDDELAWPKHVLSKVQGFALQHGFFVQRMMGQLHEYYLDDAPDLRSCNLMFRSVAKNGRDVKSEAITDAKRLVSFYGRGRPPKFRYMREKKRVDYLIALFSIQRHLLIRGAMRVLRAVGICVEQGGGVNAARCPKPSKGPPS